ncbi:MAG: triple tyrosine motif-containing protein [Flavobacteriaceae bacterium]
MKLLLRVFVIVVYGFFCLKAFAQEIPPIKNFSPQDYFGENQNWSISQSDNNTIYLANNAGLLEYDGEKWRLFQSPNESIMRSVKVIENRIYSGFYMEFGYWEKNNFGTLEYTSLSKKLDIPLIEDEQFWNIISIDNWILFQSLNRIYIYSLDNQSFKIVESKTRITKIYDVESEIYFQKLNEGIYKIQNGKEVLVNNDKSISEKIIINIFKINGGLLIQTQDDGFFTLIDNAINDWQKDINNELASLSIYNSLLLKNGDLALGTISKGLIIIDLNGEVKYRISQPNGLNNNTILSLFEDKDSNIWLGLDNGISCLNMNSSIRVFNDQNGELGSIYVSALHDNILYLGTNQGLFYKEVSSYDNFQFIKGTQGQVWDLTVIDSTLFCGHNSGTFKIEKDKASKISNIQGTWNIKQIPNHPDYLLQGNYDGLYILERNKNNNWVLSHKINGFDISSKFLEFLNESEIFVSHEYKGLFKIKLNNNFTEAETVDFIPIRKGLSSSLAKYSDKIIYANQEGLFSYDDTNKEFIKDSIIGKLYDSQTYVSGKIISDTKTNTLWSFNKEGINYLSPGKLSSSPEINSLPLPFSLRNGIVGYENILSLEDQKFLFGNSSGYITIDTSLPIKVDNYININEITVNKFNSEEIIQSLEQDENVNFENKQNNLHFSYSLYEFQKYFIAEYQYQLQGMSDTWSSWSKNAEAHFENLPFGEYTFNVRGRVNGVTTKNTDSFTFTIARPWYATNTMIVLYAVLIILFSLMMHNIYKRYYKKQREMLLAKTKKELELKKLENQQQLMSFKNEKLQHDIESKNRELAISTMNLIKKNEFLNIIKNELNNVNDNKELKSVVRIIDKNLNNSDDWNLFQEAFNNADKDFLKKIKNLHQSLTPNDLRLCAYLRLNLSSKEIAPLLNISPRSVEVKRYRLRKKMDLSHETNLTDYILEL